MLKTLKSKIALVAVAAMGASFLSIASAQATAAGALSIRTDTGGAGAGTTTSLYVGAPYRALQADVDFLTATAIMTSLTHANAGAGVIAAGSQVNVNTVSQSVQVTFNTAGASGNLVSVYSDSVGADTATLAAVTVSAAPVLTASVGPARVNSGQTIDVKVTGTGTVESDVVFKYANISKPTGATNLVLTDTLGTDVNLSTATTATTVGTLVAPDAAGTYTGVVYQDTNINGTVDPGEPSSYVSFTTAGSPASATLTPASDTKAAGAAATYTLTLKDANGLTTQAAVGEFFSITADPSSATSNVTIAGAGLASITNPGGGAGANSTAVVPFTALGDGTEDFTVASNTAGDVVTLTLASSGALRAQGVASSLTATHNVVAASAVNGSAVASTNTRLAADAATTTAASGAAAGLNTYIADPSLKSVTFTVSGLDANKAFTFDITATDANNSYDGNMTVGVNGATAAAYVSGADLSAVADSTGKVTIAWATTGTLTAGLDVIDLDLNTADTGDVVATQTDARVSWADPAYALTLTAPTTTTLLVTQTSTVAFEGTLIDQFNNPLQGAVVTITGVQTGTAVAANLTATATSDATGKWSATLAAPASTTTSVAATVTAVRTGATFSGNSPVYTINYTSTGNATTLTAVASPANTVVSGAITEIPAIAAPHDGVVNIAAAATISNAKYVLASAAVDNNFDGGTAGTGADEYLTIVPTSTPAAEVTFTSDDSVYFWVGTTDVAWNAAAAKKGTGKFASGSTVRIWSTKAGKHTVTMNVGTTSTTQDFWVEVDPNAARNLAITAPASLKQGEIGRLVVTATDNWGNPVKGVTAATISATVTGQGTLGGGRITDTFAATDAAGQAQLAIQAGNADGTLDFSVTAADANFQFSSRKGRSVYSAADTTDGLVIQLDASKGTVTAKTTVSGSAATQGGEIATVKADVKAVSDTVATLSKAVTTIQSSVTELTSSFSAQIKSLSSAIAKISRAIAALSKRIK